MTEMFVNHMADRSKGTQMRLVENSRLPSCSEYGKMSIAEYQREQNRQWRVVEFEPLLKPLAAGNRRPEIWCNTIPMKVIILVMSAFRTIAEQTDCGITYGVLIERVCDTDHIQFDQQ